MLCYAMLCYQEGNVYEGNEAGNRVVREGVDNGVVQAERGGGGVLRVFTELATTGIS